MSDIGTRFVDFLRSRIEAMGVEESGAYEYYAVRAERGEPFALYEQAVIADILRNRPARVVHAGIGMGPVIAALSNAGIASVGYEFEERRFAAAKALRDSLGLEYELRKAGYPDAKAGIGGLLLFTNVGSGWTPAQEDDVIATFANFDEVILDLRLFGSVRNEDSERELLRQRLSAAGRVEGIATAPGSHYVRIRPFKQRLERASSHPPTTADAPTSSRSVPSAAGPAGALRDVQTIDRALIRFYATRLATMGQEQSGLFEHYEGLLNRNSIFPDWDRQRLEYILESLPTHDHYVVYRAGLGELGFAIANAGRRVTVWEPNDLRRKAIRDAFEHLSKRNAAVRANFAVADGPIEDVPIRADQSTLAIAFRLLLGNPADPASIARSIARAHTLIYTPRLFLEARDPKKADGDVRVLLQDAGFSAIEETPLEETLLAARSISDSDAKASLGFS